MRGSGMSFMDKLANVLGNVATRINNLRYIMVIKNAFAALIPVIITGAFEIGRASCRERVCLYV